MWAGDRCMKMSSGCECIVLDSSRYDEVMADDHGVIMSVDFHAAMTPADAHVVQDSVGLVRS